MSTAPPPAASARLDAIDALRGFAALGVIAVHSSQQIPPFPGPLLTLAQQGGYGVQLFYVISAFTLFLSLFLRRSNHSLRDFFIRRFFRIAPLFWCAMLFYLFRDGLGPRYWLGDAPGITPFNLLATATFTNGFNPYWINSVVPAEWSVAVEMVFYLSVPFLYQRIKTARSAWVNALAWLALSLLALRMGREFLPISDPRLWNDFLYLWLPYQMPVFALGFVLFFIYRRLQAALPALPHKKAKSLGLLATCLGAIIVLSFCDYRVLPLNFLYGLVFLGATTALLLHPFRLLVNGGTTYLGKISYSAYLTHSAMLPFAERFVRGMSRRLDWHLPPEVQFGIIFALVVAGTVVVSSATYQFIELPGQNLGRRLIAKLSGKPSARRLETKPA